MKLTIERKEFQARLAEVCAVAEKKATQPVLSHFLLDANEQGRVTATDLETTLRAPLEGSIEAVRPLCLPAQKLYDIVRAAEGTEIIIQTNGADQSAKENWVHVLAGPSKFRLPVLPAADFPEFPNIKDSQEITITAGELLKLLERTAYAAAASQIERYTLQGILFHLKKKSLMLVGCDGHNLAATSTDMAGGEERKAIVPAKSAKEFQKILSGLDPEVSITVQMGKNHVLFKNGELEFAARLLEGTYPDYNRIIPKTSETTVSVSNGAFQRALERMALVHDAVALEFKGQEILLSAKSPDAGEAEESFPAEQKDGPDVKVNVLATPILKALKAIGDESVIIGLTDEQSPILLQSAQEGQQEKYKCVVMPRREEKQS